MSPKSWVYSLVLAFGLLFGAIIAITFSVDPYGIFGSPTVPRFNEKKYYSLDRIANSIRLTHDSFTTIIFGTSRTLVGMDTKDSAFKGEHVFNASMSGTGIEELYKVFNYALNRQQDLESIVYGVDFLTFSDKRTVHKQFKESLYNDEGSRMQTYLRVLFSMKALEASIETVVKNIRSEPAIVIDGYISKENIDVNHRKLFREILENNFLVGRETYGCYNYDSKRMKIFGDMLRKAVQREVTIYLFISPLHARHYYALKSLGLINEYKSWIIKLVREVEKVRQEHDAEINLWDFGGFNSVTTEAVPSDEKTKMSFYWESSHYKKQVGSVILKTMKSRTQQTPGFGVLLNENNVMNRLYQMEHGLREYIDKNHDEVEEIDALYRSTSKTRIKNCPERIIPQSRQTQSGIEEPL